MTRPLPVSLSAAAKQKPDRPLTFFEREAEAAKKPKRDCSGLRMRKLFARCTAARVPTTARCVLMALLAHERMVIVDGKPEYIAIASQADLADTVGATTRETASIAIKHLQRAGLILEIRKVPRRARETDGGFPGGVYNVYVLVDTFGDPNPNNLMSDPPDMRSDRKPTPANKLMSDPPDVRSDLMSDPPDIKYGSEYSSEYGYSGEAPLKPILPTAASAIGSPPPPPPATVPAPAPAKAPSRRASARDEIGATRVAKRTKAPVAAYSATVDMTAPTALEDWLDAFRVRVEAIPDVPYELLQLTYRTDELLDDGVTADEIQEHLTSTLAAIHATQRAIPHDGAE